MNRRNFLQKTAMITLATPFLAKSLRADGPIAEPEGPFVPLRRGVGLFIMKGGSIGYLATPDSLAVVDTQFPDSAAMLMEGLKKQTSHSLDLLINTHHHADHTAGNIVIGPLATDSVTHQNVPPLQRQAAAKDGTAIFCAKSTYETTYKTSLGDETIALHYHGPAHTSGDSVVHFEQANVVHMGDIVFNHRIPFIDRPAGGSVRNWITTLEKVYKTFSGDTLFIYGHAGKDFKPHGTRADLLVMRDYLSALLATAAEALKAGKSEDETASIPLIKGFESYGSGDGKLSVDANLRVAYQELSGSPL